MGFEEAATTYNTVLPTLSKDECGWDASATRATLSEIGNIGEEFGVVISKWDYLGYN